MNTGRDMLLGIAVGDALGVPVEFVDRAVLKSKPVTALTHGHIRSVIANLIYILLAEYLMEGIDKDKAYLSVKTQIRDYFECFTIPKQEQQRFMRILDFDIASFEETEIRSDGYVVHSLEAALWSFLRNDNYDASVLTAVNLGGDTDTIAAITGGLAGITYGEGGIPKPWKEALVGRKKIEALGDRLFYRYYEE